MVLTGCGKKEDKASDSAPAAPQPPLDQQEDDPPPTYDEAIDVVKDKLDLESPVPGSSGKLTVSAVKADGLRISFAKATDNKSTDAELSYALYYSTSTKMASVNEVEDVGTLYGNFDAGISSITINGALVPHTTYTFNVIVKDKAGNRASYKQVSQVTGKFPLAGSDGQLNAAQDQLDVTVSWTEATNGDGSLGDLDYALFRSNSDNLTSPAEILANGTQIGSWVRDESAMIIPNPGPSTRLYLNVLVRDLDGNFAAYESIVFDTDAILHFSYTNVTTRELKYVRRNGPTWDTPVVVDTEGDYYTYGTSIAADSAGNAHIAYFENVGRDLRYATNLSGSFQTETVASTGNTGYYATIALNQAGSPFIAALNTSFTDLVFYFQFFGGWANQDAYASSDAVGYYANMIFDKQDKAHIVHRNDTTDDLLYSTNQSGTWVTEVVESVGDVGQYPSIGIDSKGKIHIAHYSVTDLRMHYVTNESGSWVTTIPDNEGSSGQYTSLAIGSDDSVHIAYYSVAGTKLRYLVKTGSEWQAPTDIDGATTTTGTYNTSLKLDRLNRPYVAYHDDTANTLKCAYKTSSESPWTIVTVDDGNGDDVGRFPSLAVQ
jgi:hypothetical protein